MKMNIFSRAIAAVSVMGMMACGSSAEQQPTTATDSVQADAPPAAASLKDLQWLNGWWQKVTPDGIVFEIWSAAGETMAGKSGFIKGKDTMLAETMVLEMRGADIYYIPTVKDQNNGQPVPFRLTTAAADSFVFENPEHDFPSKIVYRKTSETALIATISGKIQGKDQAESFELAKTQ
ncbi:hypothetical protein GCM10023093_18540 [Nemorincola caseinilytica]|uniref:DUF6265 domain-containing protein n=1 Tax=Nemorincola caseinilytica TaxID=2054315 RepID=A0ABP8NH97_9BACT